MSGNTTCQAIGCGAMIPRKHLMCGRHWRMVSVKTQALVYREYERGFSTDYFDAVKQAQTEVADVEAPPPQTSFLED